MAEFIIITPEKAKEDGSLTSLGMMRLFNFGEELAKEGNYFKIIISESRDDDNSQPLLVDKQTADTIRKGGNFPTKVVAYPELWPHEKRSSLLTNNGGLSFESVLEIAPRLLADLSKEWADFIMERKKEVETYILIGNPYVINALLYFICLTEDSSTHVAEKVLKNKLKPLSGYKLAYDDTFVTITDFKNVEIIPRFSIHELNLVNKVIIGHYLSQKD